MMYEKYQAGLTALCNVMTSNIYKYFVSLHNNSITGFCLVDPIVLTNYTRTNYVTVLSKKLQENEMVLDAQWDRTTPLTVLFTRIEDCKLFSEDGEEL